MQLNIMLNFKLMAIACNSSVEIDDCNYTSGIFYRNSLLGSLTLTLPVYDLVEGMLRYWIKSTANAVANDLFGVGFEVINLTHRTGKLIGARPNLKPEPD